MLWKYALIKVGFDSIEEKDIGELVELYYEEVDGEVRYSSYGRPYLQSIEEIRRALRDVEKDGLITWFWDNGVFTWNTKEYFWDWSKNA